MGQVWFWIGDQAWHREGYKCWIEFGFECWIQGVVMVGLCLDSKSRHGELRGLDRIRLWRVVRFGKGNCSVSSGFGLGQFVIGFGYQG